MESVLPLSQKTLVSLRNLNALSTSDLLAVNKSFLQMLLTGSWATELEKRFEEPLWSLSTFFLQAGKYQSTIQTLGQILSEAGCSESVKTTLLKVYADYADKILDHLRETAFDAAKIVDVDWRLDYHVRSKAGGKENKPMFFVTLVIMKEGLLERIELLASQEELQDFFNKTRDAIKQVERLLTSQA